MMNRPVKLANRPEARPRTNLRLTPELWQSIDGARLKRPGNVSRNTWITEAVQEKLARERKDHDKGSGG